VVFGHPLTYLDPMKTQSENSQAAKLSPDDLIALQKSLLGIDDERKKVLDQFDIEQMFQVFLTVNKIDRRKAKPHEINQMFRAYVGGMAHVVVLTFITVFEQKHFSQDELVNFVLAQCEKYLKSIGVA